MSTRLLELINLGALVLVLLAAAALVAAAAPYLPHACIQGGSLAPFAR